MEWLAAWPQARNLPKLVCVAHGNSRRLVPMEPIGACCRHGARMPWAQKDQTIVKVEAEVR